MSDLSSWFKERPKWLQEATRMLLEKGSPGEDEIKILVDLCQAEATDGINDSDFTFPSDAFGGISAFTLRMNSIGNVKGVNALAPKNPLDFGTVNLSVVYGSNGSGKSGYVRILKHACGARNPGTLHPNVYSTNPESQQCQFTFEKDGTRDQVEWNASIGLVPDLRSVDIFDTDCGRMYLESENEVTYEPSALSFFSDLIAICESVSGHLDNKRSKRISKKPDVPSDIGETELAKWYSQLSTQTPLGDVAKNCAWSEIDGKTVANLEKRLAEASPGDKAKELFVKKQHADDLIKGIENHLEKLSDENCRHILELKKNKILKQGAAKALASTVFEGAPLDGIGSDTWKLLWEHARKYSEEHAYKEVTFPNTSSDATCVLCNQPISEDARSRLQSFEEYVKGESEKAARSAEQLFKDRVDDIEDRPSQETIKTKLDAAGLPQEGDANPLDAAYKSLQQRKEQLAKADSVEDMAPLPDCVGWIDRAKAKTSAYDESAKKYEQDAQGDSRATLQSQLLDLKSRKWMSDQRKAIESEIERLKAVKRLDDAKRLANTTGLSRKKGELAEELISEAFVQRFRGELAAMGASQIKVELAKTHVDRGRVLHELRLVNARSGSLGDVLSEGEHRVVSLAAFLADVTAKQHPAPFVFDDPISSLDQDYEEKVVERLVALAKDRQVIVFTHRVSLLVLLQECGKRGGIAPKITCVRHESWGAGEPGETPLFAKKPQNALNTLLNEHLAKARKANDEEGQDAYAPLAKAICSDFRILLERMIECELLADVVQRFRRAINTQGKINNLVRINAEDCKFFDGMMTRYSRYEHSQPNEAPVSPPTPDELKADLEALRDWRAEFLVRDSS